MDETGNSPSGDASGGGSIRDAARDAARAAVLSLRSNSSAETEAPAGAEEPDAESSAPAHDDEPSAPPQTDAKAVKAGEKPADLQPQAPGDEQPQAANPATLEAPKVWKREERELFAKLPPEAQKLLIERERKHNSDFTKNAQENAAHRRFADEVRSLFPPETRQALQASGMTETDMLKRVIGGYNRLAANPAQEIRTWIQRAGLRPEDVFPGAGSDVQPSSTQGIPPAEAAQPVNPEFAKLQSQVSTLTGVLQEAFQQTQMQALSRFESEVTNFETETDEAGNLKHPHFEVLFDHMMQLLQHDPEIAAVKATQPREAIAQAYEKASYLHPEIRQQIIDLEFSRRASAQGTRVAAAKAKAAASPRSSPGAAGTGIAPKKMSVRDAAIAGVKSAYNSN